MNSKDNISYCKTAIIGAGISGISTAINLLNNSYEDFLVFEVNDRIGGRCYTIDYDNDILEMGAQFIHGQVNNPIYKIAIENGLIDDFYKQILYENEKDASKHNGLKVNFHENGANDEVHQFYTQNGSKIDQNLFEKAFNCLNKVIKLAEVPNHFGQDRRLGDFLYENFMQLMQKELDPEELEKKETKEILNGIFGWRSKAENVENGCDSVFNLSLNNYSNCIELRGSQIMELNKGYRSVLECIISKNKEKFYQRLRLNNCLKEVLLCQKLDNTNEVSCEHCEYTQDKNKIVAKINDSIVICDNLVCTLSLGVLKEKLSKLIKPERYLSEEKLGAVSRLGFGTVNKIFLVYDKPFWTADLFYPIWINENKQKVFDDLSHKDFDLPTRWFEDICFFEAAINNKNILIAWIGGNYYHESLSDDQVKNECTKILKKFLGRDDIPEPKDILRSKWHSEPHFKGSYAFYPFGSKANDIDSIGEPISFEDKPYVLFAGEATSQNYFSTVHGAFLTGIRESERILNLKQ